MEVTTLGEAVDVVSGLIGVASFFVDLFSGGSYGAMQKILGAVQALVAQQHRVVSLMFYIATLSSTLSTNPVFSNLQNIQSSVDHFNSLNEATWPQPYSSNFYGKMLAHNGLEHDLSTVFHNAVQDSLDLSPSLLASFVETLEKDRSFNKTKADIRIQSTYFLTRILHYQVAGYAMLMYASVQSQKFTNVWLNKMNQRVQEIAIRSHVHSGSFYLGDLTGKRFPELTDSDGFNDVSASSTITSFTVNNTLCFVAILGTNVSTSCIQLSKAGDPKQQVNTWQDANSTIPAAINSHPGYYTTVHTLVCGGKVYMHMISPNIVGDHLNFYYYQNGTGWILLHSVSMVEHFPGYDNISAFYYSNVKSICIDETIFLYGQAKQFGNVYEVPSVAGSWVRVGWLPFVNISAGWGSPQHYATFSLFSFGNTLHVGIRSFSGYHVFRMQKYNNTLHNLREVFKIPQLGNTLPTGYQVSPSYYTTIRPFILNNILFVIGRLYDGIHTYRCGPSDWSQNNATSLTGPLWSDSLGYDKAPNYEHMTVYTANNVAYLATFNPLTFTSEGVNYTNWKTCAFVKDSWDCSSNRDMTLPAVPTALLSSGNFRVVPFELSGGTLPVFYYRDSMGIITYVANPAVMLTNFKV